MKTNNKKIYHYCSTQKASSILSGKSIRLSDITKSNDKLEMSILFPEFFDELILINNTFGGFDNEFIYKDTEGGMAWQLFVKELKNKIMPSLAMGEISTYVMCFSENGDLLSQWRGYADDARGIVIGFNFESIKKYVDNNKQILQLEKVVYITKEERKGLIYDCAKELLHIMDMILDAKEKRDIIFNSQKEFEERIFINIYYNILQIINEVICYKMDGFKEECEWRLYLDNPINKNTEKYEFVRSLGNDELYNQKLAQYIEKRIDFQITNKDIIPFIKISFDEIKDNLVEEIICGPNNFTREADLKVFLKKHKYNNCCVLRSKLSYTER